MKQSFLNVLPTIGDNVYWKAIKSCINVMFMLFMYAGSGPGSARERRFRTAMRGTGSRKNILAHALDEQLSGE